MEEITESKASHIKELKKEIDFLYLYPQGSMTKIRRLEEEIRELEVE